MATKPRRYMYLSPTRLDELYADAATRRDRAAERSRGGGIKVLGSGVDVPLDRPEQRHRVNREVERVRRYLEREGRLGTLDDPWEHFYGRMSMVYVPVEHVRPAVVYLVGETEQTVVALGGPLKNMVGRDPESSKSDETALGVLSEKQVAAAIVDAQSKKGIEVPAEARKAQPLSEQWAENVVRTHETFGNYPDAFPRADVELLAWREEFATASSLGGTSKGVLLGRPVFVAYA